MSSPVGTAGRKPVCSQMWLGCSYQWVHWSNCTNSTERMHKASWEIAALFLISGVFQRVRRSCSPFPVGICSAAVFSRSTIHLWKQGKRKQRHSETVSWAGSVLIPACKQMVEAKPPKCCICCTRYFSSATKKANSVGNIQHLSWRGAQSSSWKVQSFPTEANYSNFVGKGALRGGNLLYLHESGEIKQ